MTILSAAVLLVSLSASAEPKNPCDENPGLSRNGFVFDLKGPARESSLGVSFIYSRCRVEDLDHVENRPTTPRAVRIFHGDQAGYELWVETELGSNQSYLTIIEDYAGSGPKNAAWLGSFENVSLVTRPLDLGRVVVRDTRLGANRQYSGAASIRYAPFSKPYSGPLVGCQ